VNPDKIEELAMKKIFDFIYRLIGVETDDSRLSDSYK
jgi:hypothetical protein